VFAGIAQRLFISLLTVVCAFLLFLHCLIRSGMFLLFFLNVPRNFSPCIFCLEILAIVCGILYKVTFLLMVIFFVSVHVVWYESTDLGTFFSRIGNFLYRKWSILCQP